MLIIKQIKNMITLEEILSKANDTKACIICKGAGEKTPEIFKELFPNKPAVVVADANTFKAQGATIDKILKNAGIETSEPIIFTDPALSGDWKYLEQLEERLKGTENIPVAVGSGVINDLCKLASEHLERRYIIIGTAISMDGYTSYGASLSFQGNKQTFQCKAPLAVLLDPDIAANAPEGLAASGYADLLAKVPAGAEWMIADALDKDKIDDVTWDIMHSRLKASLSSPAAVKARDPEATKELAELLMFSGFAMQHLQSSRPASGIEHIYSHLWDMENLNINGKHIPHGFKVGIGTLISTASLEFLINYDFSTIDIDKCIEKWPTWEEMEKKIISLTSFHDVLLKRCLKEGKDKYSTKDEVRGELNLFIKKWPELKQKLSNQILPFDTIKQNLITVGAPYEPEMINVSREYLRSSYRIIPYMRSRFTTIDLINRLGLLDTLEDYLFGNNGPFEIK